MGGREADVLRDARANFASHKSVTIQMAWNGIRSNTPGLLEARSAFRREFNDAAPYNRKRVFEAFDRAIAKMELVTP